MSEEGQQRGIARTYDERQSRLNHLRHAIFKLAHGEGLTATRVQQSGSWLMHELGVSSAQSVCDLIQSALDSLERDKYTEALQNAFGGDGHPETLMERRRQLAARSGVSVGTIGKREEIACGLVTEKLFVSVEARAAVEPENQGALVSALLGLQQAVTEQTALLREINERFQRLSG